MIQGLLVAEQWTYLESDSCIFMAVIVHKSDPRSALLFLSGLWEQTLLSKKAVCGVWLHSEFLFLVLSERKSYCVLNHISGYIYGNDLGDYWLILSQLQFWAQKVTFGLQACLGWSGVSGRWYKCDVSQSYLRKGVSRRTHLSLYSNVFFAWCMCISACCYSPRKTLPAI